MNKKVSTLVASMLLATTVGAASAQTPKGTMSEHPSYSYLASIESGKFYQLTNGQDVLIMDKTDEGTYVLKFVPYYEAELAKSLWDIKYIKKNGENGLAFQFVNLTTGLPISYDPEKAFDAAKGNPTMYYAKELSQGVDSWSWLRGTEGASLLAHSEVEAYFGAENDSIMTLVDTRTGVAPIKYATKDFQKIPSRLKFTVKEASPVFLNAYDLNTMLQSKAEDKLHLTFNGEPVGNEFPNEFTARDYKVVDAVGVNSLSKGSVEDARDEFESAKSESQSAREAYVAALIEFGKAEYTLNKYTAELEEISKKRAELGAETVEYQGIRADEQAQLAELNEQKGVLSVQLEALVDDETLGNQLTEALEAYNSAVVEYDKWEKERDRLQSLATEAEKELNQFVETIGSADVSGSLKEVYDNLIEDMESKYSDLEAFEKHEAAYSDPVEKAKAALDAVYVSISENTDLKQQYQSICSQIETHEANLREAQAIISKNNIEDGKLQIRDAELQGIVFFANINRNDLREDLFKKKFAWSHARQVCANALNYLLSIRYMEKDWYSLKTDDNKYLMVDTAYMENYTAGIKHQKFAVREHATDHDSKNVWQVWNDRDINGRFNFRFQYFPTQDSLVITADGGNDKYETVTYWKDRVDYQISPVWGRNYVKLANLSDKHQEVTLGAPEAILGTWDETLNTRIGLNLVTATPGQNIPKGVYFADIVNSSNADENGARLMLDLDGELTKVTPAEWNVMKFEDMPAAKWVVDGTTIYGGSPAIKNQESTVYLNRGNYRVKEVKEDGTVILEMTAYNYQGGRDNATIKLTQVSELNSNGFYHENFTANTDTLFTLDYLSIGGGLAVQVGTTENDSIMRVAQGEGTKFVLEMAGDVETYGVADTLKRAMYYIRVNDANKLANNHKYVTVSLVDGTEMLVVADKRPTTSKFFLKEMNHVDGTHYYALLAYNEKLDAYDKKAGVIDASGLIKMEDITGETRTSTFALNSERTRFYRELTDEELGDSNMVKFYRTSSTDKEYLYAAAPEEGMTFLAVEGKGDNADALAEMSVIPTTAAGTLMPQYFIARDVREQKGSVDWCGEDHTSLADSLACEHTKVTPDTLFGNFLVNLKIDDTKYKKYDWEGKYTRLAFLSGYAVKDEGTMPGEGEYTTLYIDGKAVAVNENKHNAAKFEFRLVNEEPEQDFLIESESWAEDKEGKEQPFLGGVRPMAKGGWVKVQNGVPVIVSDEFENVSQADVYNVDTNVIPTANETISTTEVAIFVQNGSVVVKNAAGKNVVITTILGQIVANEVLTSDYATISVPAGIAIVSVDGETAVKVSVR